MSLATYFLFNFAGDKLLFEKAVQDIRSNQATKPSHLFVSQMYKPHSSQATLRTPVPAHN